MSLVSLTTLTIKVDLLVKLPVVTRLTNSHRYQRNRNLLKSSTIIFVMIRSLDCDSPAFPLTVARTWRLSLSWWPHITSHDCNDPHYQDHHHTLTSLHLHKARPPLPRAAVEDRGRSLHCSNNWQTSATVGLDSIVNIPSSLSLLSLALSLPLPLWSLFLLSSSSPRKRNRH